MKFRDIRKKGLFEPALGILALLNSYLCLAFPSVCSTQIFKLWHIHCLNIVVRECVYTLEYHGMQCNTFYWIHKRESTGTRKCNGGFYLRKGKPNPFSLFLRQFRWPVLIVTRWQMHLKPTSEKNLSFSFFRLPTPPPTNQLKFRNKNHTFDHTHLRTKIPVSLTFFK